jgi:hypothetical protein
MLFLETRSGSIAANSIDAISAVHIRATGNFHEIDFHVGREPRLTFATEAAVAAFRLQNSPR